MSNDITEKDIKRITATMNTGHHSTEECNLYKQILFNLKMIRRILYASTQPNKKEI